MPSWPPQIEIRDLTHDEIAQLLAALGGPTVFRGKPVEKVEWVLEPGTVAKKQRGYFRLRHSRKWQPRILSPARRMLKE